MCFFSKPLFSSQHLPYPLQKLPRLVPQGKVVQWWTSIIKSTLGPFSHPPKLDAEILQHFQRVPSRPQGPRVPPQRCHLSWPNSGWQLPVRPAQYRGCTGWCHRWNSHTLSVQGPCPWKRQRELNTGSMGSSPTTHSALVARSPCLLSTWLDSFVEGVNPWHLLGNASLYSLYIS